MHGKIVRGMTSRRGIPSRGACLVRWEQFLRLLMNLVLNVFTFNLTALIISNDCLVLSPGLDLFHV